jgi:hypothetical protein
MFLKPSSRRHLAPVGARIFQPEPTKLKEGLRCIGLLDKDVLRSKQGDGVLQLQRPAGACQEDGVKLRAMGATGQEVRRRGQP